MIELTPQGDVPSGPPALVVGFSIHGLAVARALARQGVPVHALAEEASRAHATSRTRYARLHFRRALNTGPIVEHLLDVAREIETSRKIVLFPTSDRIAKGIALGWEQLSDRYELSWSHCRDLVLKLQRKDSLPEYCDRAGVRFPRSRVLERAEDIETVAADLEYPLVIKPALPLSSFKAIKVETPAELRARVAQYSNDLPFVVQEWIEGPEPSLYACTSYLDRGRPLFMFGSRKIAASPPGLGQGTVFETYADAETQQVATQFLRQFDLSGPVAVEFKRDASGRYWLIEPNVGRTEYCVDLAIQAGYNLPYLEYLHVTGQAPSVPAPSTSPKMAWFDTDKDAWCFLANARRVGVLGWPRTRAIFPYVGHGDRGPVLASWLGRLRGLIAALGRRLPGTRRAIAS